MTLIDATYHAALPRRSAIATAKQYYNVWSQRQALKSLDAAALNDIGITRVQADAEAKRPVWDAPVNWLR
ncbi:MAG: hypothetical protein ACI8R4_001833 [Paracoccaceae bacterium]|jgi:uncharacterized protein YjiS (DUF1127 family)